MMVATLVAVIGGVLVYIIAGGDGGTRVASVAETGDCRVGGSPEALGPGAAGRFGEGSGSSLVLGCLRDRSYGGAAIVGYVGRKSETCVATYSMRLQKSRDPRCLSPRYDWTADCYAYRGCIYQYFYEAGFTHLEGPIDPDVRSLEVQVNDRTLRSGIEVARAAKPVARQLHRTLPFGYFLIVVPGCVVPDAVKINFLGAGGSSDGQAAPWESYFSCSGIS
jgi:hypothetical protein